MKVAFCFRTRIELQKGFLDCVISELSCCCKTGEDREKNSIFLGSAFALWSFDSISLWIRNVAVAFMPLQAVVFMENCRNWAEKQMELGRGRVRFLFPKDSCLTSVTKPEGMSTGMWEKAGLPNPGHSGCGEVVVEAHELTLKDCHEGQTCTCLCSL